MQAGAPWRSCWYGQPAKATGRGAVAELLVRAASESSWPGRRGGATGTGSQRKQLAGAPLEEWSEAEVCAEKLPLRGRRCACIVEELAAGRRRCGIVEELAAGRATPLQHREEAEQHREGAEQHREEAKWQQSALYSIFIPVPQAPYCHTYHNKIQKRRVILLYRE